MILNPENICACGDPKGPRAKTCLACANGEDKKYVPPRTGRAGRPVTVSDAQILAAVRAGANTPDRLMKALKMKSKSNLMRRVRLLRDAGQLALIERHRYEGFNIMPGADPREGDER